LLVLLPVSNNLYFCKCSVNYNLINHNKILRYYWEHIAKIGLSLGCGFGGGFLAGLILGAQVSQPLKCRLPAEYQPTFGNHSF